MFGSYKRKLLEAEGVLREAADEINRKDLALARCEESAAAFAKGQKKLRKKLKAERRRRRAAEALVERRGEELADARNEASRWEDRAFEAMSRTPTPATTDYESPALRRLAAQLAADSDGDGEAELPTVAGLAERLDEVFGLGWSPPTDEEAPTEDIEDKLPEPTREEEEPE